MKACIDDGQYNLIAALFTGYYLEMELAGEVPYWVFDRDYVVVELNDTVTFGFLPECLAESLGGFTLAGRVITRLALT